MASAGGRDNSTVATLLQNEPYRFEFFQAVRLLDQMARQQGEHDLPAEPLLGQDTPPTQEAIHFRGAVSASFPGCAVQALSHNRGAPAQMTVNFMGLTGPNGVLPQHVTMMLIRLQRANDERLSNFQQLFDHRLISLFYRAWEKHRFLVTYDRCRRTGRPILQDTFTRCVLSLCGFGSANLLQRYAFRDELLAYYAGHLAHRPRNAISLAALLADFLGACVSVEQFVGKWYTIDPQETSVIPSRAAKHGRCARLGRELILGERVFLADRLFRVIVGPLALSTYEGLLPIGAWFKPLQDWIGTYANPDFDAQVQLLLLAEQVPPCRIGAGGSRLAWTSFVRSKPFDRVARGATFACQERR
jgi:type VI secretion system protein ImpH